MSASSTRHIEPLLPTLTFVNGAVSLTETVTVATLGVRKTFGATTATETVTASTLGTRKGLGVVSLIETVTVSTVGFTTQFGAVSLSETVSVSTVGGRVLFGAVSLTETVTIGTFATFQGGRLGHIDFPEDGRIDGSEAGFISRPKGGVLVG